MVRLISETTHLRVNRRTFVMGEFQRFFEVVSCPHLHRPCVAVPGDVEHLLLHNVKVPNSPEVVNRRTGRLRCVATRIGPNRGVVAERVGPASSCREKSRFSSSPLLAKNAEVIC